MTYRCSAREGGSDGSQQLRIEIGRNSSGAVITLAGEIDMATLPVLQEALDAVQRDGHDHVEVQLAQVSFMSAGTLTVLQRAHAALAESGGKLVVVGPNLLIRRILTICGSGTEFVVR